MISLNLFSVPLSFNSENEILEQLPKSTSLHGHFAHVVSLNPENLVTMLENKEFEKTVRSTRFHIPDGVGTVAAVSLLKRVAISRVTGVDTMETLITAASNRSLKVVLIGGKGNLANETLECYKKRYKKLPIWSVPGYLNIAYPKKEETEAIKTIVQSVRPHLVFVSFGSPFQEIWIERHKDLFNESLVMGVGGAFAMVSGSMSRAPQWMRIVGLEWLYRLFQQPWRIWRQLKLVKFIVMVVKEKLEYRS